MKNKLQLLSNFAISKDSQKGILGGGMSTILPICATCPISVADVKDGGGDLVKVEATEDNLNQPLGITL